MREKGNNKAVEQSINSISSPSARAVKKTFSWHSVYSVHIVCKDARVQCKCLQTEATNYMIAYNKVIFIIMRVIPSVCTSSFCLTVRPFCFSVNRSCCIVIVVS